MSSTSRCNANGCTNSESRLQTTKKGKFSRRRRHSDLQSTTVRVLLLLCQSSPLFTTDFNLQSEHRVIFQAYQRAALISDSPRIARRASTVHPRLNLKVTVTVRQKNGSRDQHLISLPQTCFQRARRRSSFPAFVLPLWQRVL